MSAAKQPDNSQHQPEPKVAASDSASLARESAKHSATQINDQLEFTTAAATKVYSLIEEEGNFDLMLRVAISGGGCSGFQYGFSFVDSKSDDDFEVVQQIDAIDADQPSDAKAKQQHAVILLVDPISFQYLRGATVDYCEDINGSRFIIRNPNAKTTCGCGSSFSID